MLKEKLNTAVIRLWTEPATRKANEALYPLVAAGDRQAKHQMIHSNMGLVMVEVERFLAFLPKFGHLRDDLISHGFVGLVEAVNTMSQRLVQDANPTGLMGLCIRSCFGKVVEAEELVRVPGRTKKRKADQGIVLDTPEKEVSIFHGESDQFSYDPRRMQDLRETLDACCEDDTDREILRLREEGYVDREIANRLGLPLTTCYVMRRTMYARFLELTGWRGEA
jgi:hypothetical protein